MSLWAISPRRPSPRKSKALRALKEADQDLAYLALLTCEGLKPLSRWEAGLPGGAEEHLGRLGLRCLGISRRTEDGGIITQTVFGLDIALLENFRKDFEGTLVNENEATAITEGSYFGFPKCCAKSYAVHGYKNNNVLPEIQDLLFHWICSPGCKETMRMVDGYRAIRQIIEDL